MHIKITTLDTKTSTLTFTLLKQNWKNKKNCYRYHSSSQRSLSPFWFQLLTIFSSLIGRDFYQGQLLVFRIWKSELLLSHWLPATQILRLSNLIHILLFKLSYTPGIPICHCVYEVHGLWKFLFFFEFADQPIMKTLSVLSVIVVWAYREQCVHL